MTAPDTPAVAFTSNDRLACTRNDAHRVLVFRADDHIVAGCLSVECTDTKGVTLASTAWYDNHESLSLLFDWLGDMSATGFRDVIDKPWKWHDEYRTAVAAKAHESDSGHEVLHGGSNDETAYCDQCGWNCDAGVVFYTCPFCEDRLDDPADVERKAHLGCAADVAHDEDVAREAALS